MIAVRGTALLALPLLSMGLAACAPEDAPGGPVVPRVTVVEVAGEMVPQRISVFGTVTQRSKADVYPRTEGRIVELFAEEGDRVGRNDPLAQLEAVQLNISLDQAQAAVESKRALLRLAQEKLAEGRRSVEAQLLGIEKMEQEVTQKRLEAERLGETLENRERLFEVGGVPEGELEALRTQHQGAQTSLLQAQKDLEIARIGFRDRDLLEAGLGVPTTEARRGELTVELNVRRLAAEVQVAEAELTAALAERSRVEVAREESLVRTPIAGVVGRRYLDLGEKASPETLLYTVFDTDSVYAEVRIPEDQIAGVRPGQAAELSLEEGEEAPSLTGSVRLITPFVDPESRATRVRILLDNRTGSLVPGMFVSGSIEVGPPERALTLPVSAVALDGPGGNEVLLLRDNTVFRRGVETGEVSGGRIVIVDGVEVGDLVLADASRSIPEGTRVEVVE
ncbi:MAG: efflux RND transporter periplasmic adaptor subunit [Spirochaetaceae bacterium]